MTTTFKKSAVGITLAAIAMFGIVGSANAQTPSIDSLMQQIAALTAQLNALQGGSTGGNTCGTTYGYTATSTLRVGMSGASVTALQNALNVHGGASLTVDGSFGPATAAAVKAFQMSKGLSADGIAGPATQGALQTASMTAGTNCGNNNGGSTGSNDLDGDFGTITDVNELSVYNNEEVGEGEEDVPILSFEVEADNDGDIMIQSARISFDPTGNTGSDDLDDYVSEVTVWFDGEIVGSADADEFTQNSSDVYVKNISLDGVVIKSGDTEKLTVAVSATNTFDSSDISGDSWTVDVESLRFVDGSGVVTTEGSGTGDLAAMDYSFDFVSYSAAADTELKISTDSDSPEAGVVMVDDSSSTDDVVLLVGKLRLDGTSDVVIDELPVTFSPVGANINVMAESLKLVIDGQEYSESVPSIADGASASVVFNDLDFDLEAGDTVTFEVLADMTDMDGSIFAEGDSLTASVTSSNRNEMDVENEEGDQLSDSSEKSGTANGEAQEFRTEGVQVTLVSTGSTVTAGQSANDDLGEFTIKFKVKATGDAVYVSSAAVASLNTTGNGAVVGVERSGTATIGGVSVTIVNTTDDDQTANGNYLIEEGEEETFEITTTVQLPAAGAAGQYRALLRALDWSTTDDAVISGTGYTSNLDSFKTSYKALN